MAGEIASKLTVSVVKDVLKESPPAPIEGQEDKGQLTLLKQYIIRANDNVHKTNQDLVKTRAEHYGNGSSGSGSSSSSTSITSSSGSGSGRAVVREAMKHLGKPYVRGGDGPEAFDCSGLTMAAWRQAGVSLAHLSYSQFDQVRRISTDELQPGDLVFYFGSGAHHVGMYVGGGKMVSASNPSDGVEIIDFLGPWYGERFSGAGRVVG